ncbi:hypothetical protein IC802_00040 [Geobacillus sp. 44C]|nr:hypothetical protein IC802_00040 [Geobacillus sp. 44C]
MIEMFDGRIDEAFIEKRTRIAVTHLKIELLPKWYMCAFQQLQLSILEAIASHIDDPLLLIESVKSVTKILSFEQQLVLEQYWQAHEEVRMQMYQVKMISNCNYKRQRNNFLTYPKRSMLRFLN